MDKIPIEKDIIRTLIKNAEIDLLNESNPWVEQACNQAKETLALHDAKKQFIEAGYSEQRASELASIFCSLTENYQDEILI